MKVLQTFCASFMVSTVLADTKRKIEKNGLIFQEEEKNNYTLYTNEMHVLPTGSIADIEDMEYLSIIDEEVTEIQPGAFRNLPKLVHLFIVDNDIPNIKTGIFNSLTALKILNLIDNNISSIDTDAFDNLTKLENIGLSNNKLKVLDAHWFDSKPSLQFINLGSNLITEIPDTAFASAKSEGPFFISLDRNKITKIDRDAFQGLGLISILSLESCEIKAFTGEFLHGVNIEDLQIIHNEIECIESEHFETAFTAQNTLIYGNPWKPACLEKMQDWANDHNKNVTTSL